MEHSQAAWWQRPDQASSVPSMLGLRGSNAVAAGLSGQLPELDPICTSTAPLKFA